MTEYAIEIEDLTKIYQNNNLALDHLSLKVPKGKIFGLLGPNGSGKSTLINILSGAVVKSSGKVLISSVDIDEEPKKSKFNIGIVPQEIALDSFFTLWNGLELFAGYYGIRPQDRKTKELLQTLNLWEKKDDPPKRLSGGMKRRFLIAKAMVHSPDILILDEPTAGVDIELRNQLWEYIKKLNDQGITIIITTHYLAEAQNLCDEIAFINNGKIVKQDSKENILRLGSKHIDIEFEKEINLNKIKLPKNIEIFEIDDRKIRIALLETDIDYKDIFLLINKFDTRIIDFSTSEPQLEEIFHNIMLI